MALILSGGTKGVELPNNGYMYTSHGTGGDSFTTGTYTDNTAFNVGSATDYYGASVIVNTKGKTSAVITGEAPVVTGLKSDGTFGHVTLSSNTGDITDYEFINVMYSAGGVIGTNNSIKIS